MSEVTEEYLLNNGYEKKDTYSGGVINYSIYKKEMKKILDTNIYIQFFRRYDTEYLSFGWNGFKSCMIRSGISLKAACNFVFDNETINSIDDLIDIENKYKNKVIDKRRSRQIKSRKV